MTARSRSPRWSWLAFAAAVGTATFVDLRLAAAQAVTSPDVTEFEATITPFSNRGLVFAGTGSTRLSIRLAVDSFVPWQQANVGGERIFRFDQAGRSRFTIDVTGPGALGIGERTVTFNGSGMSGRPQDDEFSLAGSGSVAIGRLGNRDAQMFLVFEGGDFGPPVNPRTVLPLNLSHWHRAVLFIQLKNTQGIFENEIFLDLRAQTRAASEGEACDLSGVELAIASLQDDLGRIAGVEDSVSSIGAILGEWSPTGDTVSGRLGEVLTQLTALQADVAAVKDDLAAVKTDTDAIKAHFGIP